MALPGETVASGAPGPDENPNVRGPLVMSSAAGYYVGYEEKDEEFGFWEPSSRESGYYPTSEAAQAALDSGEYGR